MKTSFIAAALFLGVSSYGCQTAQRSQSTVADATAAEENISYVLRGFDETVLVGDIDGNLVLLKLGDHSTRRGLAEKLGGQPVFGMSANGKFVVLTDTGYIKTIDPVSASIEKSIDTKIRHSHSLQITNPLVGYVSSDKGTDIFQVDLASGLVTEKIDLKSAVKDNGKILLRQMLVMEKWLFVEVQRTKNSSSDPDQGAIAVINMDDHSLQKIIELEVTDSNSGTKISAFNPDGAMVYDDKSRKIFISAKGIRPRNTGMIVKIDLDTLTLDSSFLKADPGFQGPMAAMTPSDSTTYMMVAYHTSTPSDSTHLFRMTLDHGDLIPAPTPEGGTLIDAFEVISDFPINGGKDLIAFPLNCPTGFCVGGKGISFINAHGVSKDEIVLPRLKAADIGIDSEIVVFLKSSI